MTRQLASSQEFGQSKGFFLGLPHTRLQARLTVLLILAAVPVFVIGALFINWRGRQIIGQQAEEQLRLVNNTVAKETSAQLKYSVQTLEQLALMPAIYEMKPEQQVPVLKAVNAANPDYYLVHVLDLTGMNTARNDGAENKDYHDRFYFQIPVSGGPVTFQTVMGKTSGRPALTVGIAIRDTHGDIVGVMGLASELTGLSNYVQASRIGSTGYAYVVDEKNFVVAHPDPTYTTELTDFSAYPPVAMLREGKVGSITFTDEEGRAWHANVTVLDNGWGVIVQQQDYEYLRTITTFGNISLGVLGAGLLVLLAIIWLVIRQATRPIAALTRTAAAIADGDLAQVAPVTSTDEIGVLASTFNHMTSQLRNLIGTLEQRVAKRTAELEQKAEDLARANQYKSEFLASMSHELRTPLNAILTFNDLLAMGTFGPVNEEQVDYLQKSLSSGKHLLSLINDVLDVAKMQSGTMKLFIEGDFDIATELNDIVASTEMMLKDKPVTFKTDIDSEFPPMACDKRRIRQVLLNLVSNAIKFTERGAITLSAKKRGDEVVFAVTDTGPGIAPESQSLIFEPFIQTEQGIRHAGGTGLGLPISKSLVEAHGGRIWVESTPGQGSKFYISLPLHQQQMASIEEA